MMNMTKRAKLTGGLKKRGFSRVPVAKNGAGKIDLQVGVLEASGTVKGQGISHKLSTAVGGSLMSLMVTDANGIIEYVNPKFSEVTGYALEKVKGKTPRFLRSNTQYDADYKQLMETISSGQEWSGEFCNRKANGDLIWEVATISPVKNAAGKIASYIAVKMDITGLKKAEEDLKKSDQRLSFHIQNSPLAFIEWNADFKVTDWSPAAERIFGYSKSEALGRHAEELLLTPAAVDEVEAIWQSLLRSEGGQKSGNENKTKSDKKIICEWFNTPIMDEQGQIIGVSSLVNDVTEREKDILALEKAEARNKSIIDNSPSFISLINRAGNILDSDLPDAGNNSTGILADSPLKSIVNSADEKLYLSEVNACFESGKPRDFDVHGANGEFVYQLLLAPVKAGNHEIDALVCNIFDVTDRRHAKARIKEQAALHDNTQDAIGVVNMAGKITFWNKGAERLYGWSAAEIQGQDISVLVDHLDDDSADSGQLPFDDILASGQWIGELKHTTKLGVEVIVESRVNVVKDEHDKPLAFLFSNTDITEKKKLDLQMLRTQRMESIGVLAGGIAHDLNNVLGPILMSLQILKRKLADGESSKIIDTLENSARRGAEIIKQVLTFARGTKGEYGVIQPKHILAEIANIIKETFPKSITLKTEFPKNLWTIHGDATQLHQVLLNLSVNARDAMPTGGDLSLKATNVLIDQDEIDHKLRTPGPYIRFEVQDTGIGIPPEIMQEIFEPFFTTKDEGKGTGLGLATVNSIVESHHGFVVVDSVPGVGTTFRAYFPASEESEVLEQNAGPADIPLGNDELILVADDEVSVGEITKETLETFGYRVITAVDGLEAMTLFAENKDEVSVVITDMEMPVMDGLATIKALKKRYPDVKIIAASGHLSDPDRERALAAGALIFLQKPFTAEALLESLAATLAK